MVVLESWVASINGPSWFYGIDSLFQIIFIIATLLIYSLSVKAHSFTKKFSSQKKYKNFGLAFLFLAFAYIILALSNLALYTGFYDGVVRGINFANLFFFAHMVFILVGYSVLLLVSLKVRDKKSAVLMFSFMLMFILFSYQYFIKFHLVSLILLIFIAYQFWENYLKQKSFNSALVFITFYFLGVGEIFYLLSVVWAPSFYAIAHLMQFVGFGLVAAVYMRLLRNG
ncbi:MAG: hypothetical protein U9Q69_01550 [Nanoarchaeota archaeon]|nr:hypothetical protein [Nanoarchaeota archaeon]